MARIKKNDMVIVIAGNDRGKKGKVLRVLPKENKLIVEGINFVKRHRRQTPQGIPAGIHEKEAPIYISNVMLICPKCSEPTRVSKAVLPDGRRVRICKKCSEMVDA